MGTKNEGNDKGMRGVCPVVLSALKVGSRVMLCEMSGPDVIPSPSEEAEILDIQVSDDYAVVQVPPHDAWDDGIREITLDQIVRIL